MQRSLPRLNPLDVLNRLRRARRSTAMLAGAATLAGTDGDGGYVNDWYLTTGSPSQWQPHVAHC